MARSNASDNAHNTLRNNQTNQNNSIRNPHYENIYESIDRYCNAPAPAPADNIQNAQIPNNNINNNNSSNNNNNAGNVRNINLRNRNNIHYNASSLSHPRNGAYDVPRQARNYYATNAGTSRRATFDINPNRMRYANANRTLRQRSFDDTESFHYSHNNNFRYENIYEQIREEPIYRNTARDNAANRLYGRMDVIGHGIGRIERHLSSSCGNIDHYNLGGTYAILGHSHLSTVGHVYANNNNKETAGKSLNFFSCLGKENSQSMSNICRDSSNGNTADAAVPTAAATAPAPQAVPPQNENASKHTGAIPKIKNRMNHNNIVRSNPNPVHSTALNRISKSSLQWLLMNKWLPLWIGNGSDCNVLDFNFMFSRNCGGCERDDNLVVYDDSNDASYANYRSLSQGNNYTAPRPLRHNNSLARDGETNPHRMYGPNRRPNFRSNQNINNPGYNANEVPSYNYPVNPQPENPFRRWELNSENNSFRPASVRRITDGTFPNANNQSQEVRVEINQQPVEENAPAAAAVIAIASTSSSNSSNFNNNRAASSSQLRADRRAFENGALSSSTESASEAENKVLSPDLSARRYSENTEDDQYKSGNSSSTDDEENDETISEFNTNDTDNSERNDAPSSSFN